MEKYTHEMNFLVLKDGTTELKGKTLYEYSGIVVIVSPSSVRYIEESCFMATPNINEFHLRHKNPDDIADYFFRRDF